MEWKHATLRTLFPIALTIGLLFAGSLVMIWLPTDRGTRQSAGLLYIMPASGTDSDSATQAGAAMVVLDPDSTSSEWLENLHPGDEVYTVEWIQQRRGVGGTAFPLAYQESGWMEANRVGASEKPGQQISTALRDAYAEWLATTNRADTARLAAAGEYRKTRILWPNVARHVFLGLGAMLWIISLVLLPAYVREQRRFRRAAKVKAGTCPACGYHFGVANPQRCSECGEAVGEAAGDGGAG